MSGSLRRAAHHFNMSLIVREKSRGGLEHTSVCLPASYLCVGHTAVRRQRNGRVETVIAWHVEPSRSGSWHVARASSVCRITVVVTREAVDAGHLQHAVSVELGTTLAIILSFSRCHQGHQIYVFFLKHYFSSARL